MMSGKTTSSKAFIFSIDAFVAFTLALLAIYSLIFFSSIPSAHYSLLTQAHDLAKDALLMLSVTTCTEQQCTTGKPVSTLDYIVFIAAPSEQVDTIEKHLDKSIPNQYGYMLEVSDGTAWETIYDTALYSSTHAKTAKKLSVSSYAVAFDFDVPLPNEASNPYKYNTCDGDQVPCGQPIATYNAYPKPNIKIVKITVYA